ncbi:MAG: RsmB/NOP family class I SAM-dependent RNA methyltransferase [Proteobacteria bacterium]|nr:RsmB/NOP family class I SAM-dependent RNA methyltransferase [Pseudomonadota bacterium]
MTKQGDLPDARDLAIAVIRDVVWKRLALDERLDRLGQDAAYQALSGSDRGLVRAIALSALRGLGLIRHALNTRLREGMPTNSGVFEPAMIAGIAQILFLDVPDYAAVDTTIGKLRQDRRADRYVPLANAVLRAIARESSAIAAADPLSHNTPEWLARRWTAAYGEDAARAIAAAHLVEPPLDLSVRADAALWAKRLSGHVLAGGTVRLQRGGAIPDLPGFAEGAWWVQDAAAAVPARLLDIKQGERVLDLCAAPGGKTAQLATTGAKVVAVDRSAPRLKRLEANLKRLGLAAETHVADGLTFEAEPFDHVLLDAPCSATGTIRRHPDVAWNKTLSDIATLSGLQSRLLDKAWSLLKPGGRLVYATCSLETEEGEGQARAFLARTAGAQVVPPGVHSLPGGAEMITSDGFFRAFPAHLAASGGCDGFFSAVFEKTC